MEIILLARHDNNGQVWDLLASRPASGQSCPALPPEACLWRLRHGPVLGGGGAGWRVVLTERDGWCLNCRNSSVFFVIVGSAYGLWDMVEWSGWHLNQFFFSLQFDRLSKPLLSSRFNDFLYLNWAYVFVMGDEANEDAWLSGWGSP